MATQVRQHKRPLYTFKSKPTTCKNKWKRYRENYLNDSYTNIMHDRHIVRGSNWSHHNVVQERCSSKDRYLLYEKKHAKEELDMFQQVQKSIESRHVNSRTQTTCDLVPIENVAVDNDAYFPMIEHGVKPPAPKYVPSRKKKSKHTQVELGDLFVFDLEVRPIVELVVGKVVDQSVIELVEEEEINVLREQEERFTYLRNCEMAAMQMLEVEHKRLTEEKERRFRQELEVSKKENKLADKNLARFEGKNLTENLEKSVFKKLTNEYFYDHLRLDVEKTFLTHLSKKASEAFLNTERARVVLDIIIRDVADRRTRGDFFNSYNGLNSYSDLTSNCLDDIDSAHLESRASSLNGNGDDFHGVEVLDAPSQHDYIKGNSSYSKLMDATLITEQNRT